MKHNIYLIRPTREGEKFISYDCYTGFIVIAGNEEEARNMIIPADEGNIWISHSLASCKKIGESNRRKEVVLSDFHEG